MRYKTIKIFFLFFQLTFVNVYGQKCNQLLELIHQSENGNFSNAPLQFNIVKYLECIEAPQKTIDFFKTIVFLVKHNDVYLAKNIENHFFIIDKDFKVIKETENRIGFTPDFNQFILDKTTGKFKRTEELIDKKGNSISEKYEDITFLGNKHIEVYEDAKFGVIDSTGKVIIPLEYNKIQSYSSSKNLFIAQKNKLKGIINSQNQIILPFEYSDIEYSYSTNFFAVSKNEKFGIVNKKNQIIVPLQHRGAKVVNDSCFIIIGDYGSYICDQTGKQISKTYSHINQFYNLGNDHYTEVEDFNGSGVISLQNIKEIIPTEYDEVRVRENFISIKKNGLYGIASFNGSILFPIIFEEKFYELNQFNKARKNSKYGIIDNTGKTISDFIYDEIFIYRDYIFFKNYNNLNSNVAEKDYAVLVKSGKSQIIDLKTNLIIADYDFEVHSINKNFFWVKKNGLWGTFNPNKNDFIVYPKYDSPMYKINNGLIIIQHKEKYGLLDFRGEEIQPPKYDNFSYQSTISSDTMLVLINNEKQYYINLFGIIREF